MQTEDSQLIVGRFFEALYFLIEHRAIRGKQTFTRRYGINRWNMQTLEHDHKRDIFQPAWLTYLVEDYGISPLWLLTGKGEIIEDQKRLALLRTNKQFKPRTANAKAAVKGLSESSADTDEELTLFAGKD